MIAARDIRAEMRHACRAISHPATQPGNPIRLAAPGRADDEPPIAHWAEAAFESLTRAAETGEPFALVACRMNGQPAVAIAATHNDGTRTHFMPLFLAVQPWMKFQPQPEDEAS